MLARDGYAPKALNTRGDRLVFSNGMIILGIAAIGILIIYQASLTTLIQLYIIGVFVSFSLGQIGMVRHWRRSLRELAKAEDAARSAVDTAAWTSLSTLPLDGPSAVATRDIPGLTPISPQTIIRERRAAQIGLVINSVGATLTIFVLAIVTITKFTHGAWLVFLLIPVLATLMVGVHRYYRDVEHEIRVDDETHFGSEGDRRTHPREPAAEARDQGHRLRAGGHARQDTRHPHRGERGGVRGAPAPVGEARASPCRS